MPRGQAPARKPKTPVKPVKFPALKKAKPKSKQRKNPQR